MNTQLINTINEQIADLAMALYNDERQNGYNGPAHAALEIMAWELDYLSNGAWPVNVLD